MRAYTIKYTITIGIFLFVLVFGCFNATATYITLEPSTQIVAPGDDFTVDVLVVPIMPDTAIAGLQFDIEFDSSKIQVDEVSKGEFLDSSRTPSFTNYGNIDNNAGIVSDIYGVVLGQSSILESGSFVSITMSAKEQATSTSTIYLKNVIISDSSGHPIDVTIKNTTLTIKEASDEPDNFWWSGWNSFWQDDWRHFW